MSEPLKPWERPWTVQEIRDHAANWSLAGDAGLLQHLTQLSRQFVEQMQSSSKSVDSLFAELEHTQCNLINVRSNFSALGHSQFVENRVAEDDEQEEESLAENCKAAADSTTEEHMRMVLQNSLLFLDEMFEPVDLPAGSDSEDEDCSPGGRRVVLKPINPYANRPLPHIIGSKEFDEDDTVGLVFTPSDEEDSPAATPQQQPQQMYGSSSGSELGLPSEEEDADDMFSPPRSDLTSQPLSFADELASKLGAAIGAPTIEVPADSTTTFPPLEQQEPPGLFGDEEEEAEDTIFGPSHGPFSTSKGLFDDLITTAKGAEASSAEKSKLALGGLFVDDDDGLFSASAVQKNTHQVSKNSVLLFSDEDDLFAVPPMPREKSNDLFNEPASPKVKVEYIMPKPVTPHTTTAKPVEKEASVKKLPAGAVSIFGGQRVFPTSSLQRTASTSSEDSTKQNIVTPEPTKIQSSDKPVSIFDASESDDDLFAENKPPKSQTPQLTKTQHAVSLFADLDENQAKIPLSADSVAQPAARTVNSGQKSLSNDKKKNVSSLFNESDSDEDLLFSSTSSGGSSKLMEPTRTARHDLFHDSSDLFDDAHDLFGPNKSSQLTMDNSTTVEFATAAKPSLPLDAAESTQPQDDLFSEVRLNIPSVQKSCELPAKPSSLLFVAESTQSQDYLFSEVKSNTPSVQKSSQLPSDLPAKPNSLLFDAESTEPQDDLFKPNIPSVQKSCDLPAKPSSLLLEPQDDIFKPNIPSVLKSCDLPAKPNSLLFDAESTEPQDDIFKPNIPSVQKSCDLPAKPNSLLFDAESTEPQDDLFKPNIPSVQKSSQLDIISDDDLFDTSSKKIKERESGKLSTGSTVKPELLPKVQIPVKSSQPADDMVAPSPSGYTPKPKTAKKPDLQTSDNVLSDGPCLIPPKTLGVTSVLTADDPTSSSLCPADAGDIANKSPVQRGRELGINPLTLLPGKKPLQPPTPPEVVSQEIKSAESPTLQEEAISFDSPTLATTLHCPGKDRIRIQQKRKPSTRRGRHGQPAKAAAPSLLAPALVDREPPPLPPTSPSTDEDDMFDVLQDTLFHPKGSSDLFADIPDAKMSAVSGSNDFLQTHRSSRNEDKSKYDELLFIHPESNSSIVEDLFSLDKNRKSEEDVRTASPDDLFLPSAKNEKVSANKMDDELFGDFLARPNVSAHQATLQQPTAKDDLFSESPRAPAANTASLPNKRDSKNDIFGDTDDDKDIFSSWVSTKPSKPTTNMDLFGDEDDDLFSSSAVKSSRPKPAASKVKSSTTVVSSEQDEFQDPLMLFQSK